MERLTKLDKYGHPYTNEPINCRNLVSKDGVNYQYVGYVDNFKAFDGKPIDKLYAIENIEEELGIHLEVLFKALKEGVWTKGGYYDSCYLDAIPTFVKGNRLHIGIAWYTQYDKNDYMYENGFDDENAMCIFSMDYEEVVYATRLKDYGKTWALTREELE